MFIKSVKQTSKGLKLMVKGVVACSINYSKVSSNDFNVRKHRLKFYLKQALDVDVGVVLEGCLQKEV